MSSKLRIFTILILALVVMTGVYGQTFSLDSFEEDRNALKKELNLSGTKADQYDRSFVQLDKQLLKLNEEMYGKSPDQVNGLIQKKYKKANESLSGVLSSKELAEVTDLNTSQMTSLTESLTGEKGLIGTHGLVGADGLIGTHGKGEKGVIVVTGKKQ